LKKKPNVKAQLDIIAKKVGLTTDEKEDLISLLRRKAKKEKVDTGVMINRMYINVLKCHTCKEQVITGSILEVIDRDDVNKFTSMEHFRKYHPKAILTRAAKRVLNKVTKKGMQTAQSLVPA
jgi:hypothetical protein